MKITQLSNRVLLLLILFLIATGCTHTPLTPTQTVEHFWTAVITGNVESAARYASLDSVDVVKKLNSEYTGSSVTFGKVNLESTTAGVETVLVPPVSQSESTTPESAGSTFTTVLKMQDTDWKVDYVATRKSLDDSQHKKGLSKLADDLGKLGRDVSGQLNGVIKNWEKITPEIKKNLEDMGASVQKQLQDSIDKHGPEVQKKLQEFTESLDDALKDLGKKLPKSDSEKKEISEEPDAKLI